MDTPHGNCPRWAPPTWRSGCCCLLPCPSLPSWSLATPPDPQGSVCAQAESLPAAPSCLASLKLTSAELPWLQSWPRTSEMSLYLTLSTGHRTPSECGGRVWSLGLTPSPCSAPGGLGFWASPKKQETEAQWAEVAPTGNSPYTHFTLTSRGPGPGEELASDCQWVGQTHCLYIFTGI